MNNKAPRQNEAALACAARRGEKDALLRLLQDNWSWLRGLAYNVLGNPDDVDEAMQNICLRVIDKIHTLNQPESFKPWLAKLARHAALAVRRQRRRRPLQLDESVALLQPDETISETLDYLSRQEQHQRILQALALLPEKYREVFILKHLDDHTYAQIAEILGVPITTVQIRLVRARRLIYNRLTGKPTDKIPRT